MFDFIIIGGGIIGLLTAKELQQTGARVAIIEKNSPEQQATRAAGGILSPMRPWHYSDAVNAISQISQSLYRDLSQQLHSATGIDPEWIPSGMLVLHDEEIPDATHWCQQHQSPYEMLSPKQFKQQFPYLKPITQPALFRNDVATIRPPRLADALSRYLSDQGVSFFKQNAQSLLFNKQQISGVQLADEVIKAKEYIICGGAWSPQLIPAESHTPEILPVKGQMICFPAVDLPQPCMVMDGNRYIIPRLDGQVVVGSTRENTGFDASTSPEAFAELREFAEKLLPALKGLEPHAHWAGLRPSSPDSIPYICRVEPYDNLSLNAGHFRNGIVLAPASAQVMVDILLERSSHIDGSPYQLRRSSSVK